MNSFHLKTTFSNAIELISNYAYTKRSVLLFQYQQKVLQVLGWVETNPEWLFEILALFSKNRLCASLQSKAGVKNSHTVYYGSRANLSYQVSDEELLKQIVACYKELSGMGIETLGDRVSDRFKNQKVSYE